MVLVIDYGAGNIASVKNSLLYLGYNPISSSSPQDIEKARSIILPGVGDGRYMMQQLGALKLIDPIQQWGKNGNPLLGICVGAQVMLSFTEEGNETCLGIFPGMCKKFTAKSDGHKIPHMGWNTVAFSDKNIRLFHSISSGADFYFVHSYYLAPSISDLCLATTDYIYSFTSIMGRDNVFGVQFHPEKSGKNGLQLLDNFLRYY